MCGGSNDRHLRTRAAHHGAHTPLDHPCAEGETMTTDTPRTDAPSIWFMFDNHTFRKIQSGWTDQAIFNELRSCFDEDGSGHVFVRHWPDGPTEPSLELDAYNIRPGEYFVTDDEITDWIKRFRAFTFKAKPPTNEELQRELAAAKAEIERLRDVVRVVLAAHADQQQVGRDARIEAALIVARRVLPGEGE